MEDKKPTILVTNDDGITAKGIKALVQLAQQFGQVTVVAPDKPQSGMGHAVSIHGILRVAEYHDFGPDVQAFACSGTPADCVKFGISQVLKSKPDLVLSGINHGNNSATNILYSGTMSAAIEGAMEGVMSVGLSLLDYDSDANFEACIHFGAKIIDAALKDNHLPQGFCLNVNFPKGDIKDIKGIKFCRQAEAFWDDWFEHRKDPGGKDYYWLTGEFHNHDHGDDTDEFALANQYISVVPVQYDLTAYHTLKHIQQWEL
ncbi:MAG: 5'/3'-nucleotidase SurE [Bacteroidota bacterium]